VKQENIEQIETALSSFIVRVAEGKATSETEAEVLPEVVKALTNFSQSYLT
jgi:hypothetical protein